MQVVILPRGDWILLALIIYRQRGVYNKHKEIRGPKKLLRNPYQESYVLV
jgi:hypothetical protein